MAMREDDDVDVLWRDIDAFERSRQTSDRFRPRLGELDARADVKEGGPPAAADQ
jgi:hypothetical protein